ncbi:GGDEF domain-containing protein [Psychromonas aquatilis]|uniref:GGDEF domain-containing protein n=1 Tax=Psychromonas aquatilis TaxID=2005072 RepID=A0ABU9GN17_9GAMM
MSFFPRTLLTSFLLIAHQHVVAIELPSSLVPASIMDSYENRQTKPLTCIKDVTAFVDKVAALPTATGPQRMSSSKAFVPVNRTQNQAPLQLLASCYIEVENYEKALSILMPLLKTPNTAIDRMRSLNLIAGSIPSSERPALNNQTLIKMMQDALVTIEQDKQFNFQHMGDLLNLSITKLALETHQYQLANKSLGIVKNNLKNTTNTKLFAWLAYYYGHYYYQINQQQLAIGHFQTANNLADSAKLIKLSSLVKKSLANLYQENHRYTHAISFASQRVEVLLKTENYVEQADSLIRFAVLKRQNNEFNQATIYLFNAIELIEKKNKKLLAYTYLELGRTYASMPNDIEKNAVLAQKYLQNARNLFKKLNRIEQQTESVLLLAQLNIRNKNTGLAILQLERVLALAKGDLPELRVKAFEMLALSYELAGDHQQANFYFKNFHTLQNAIKEKLFKLQQLKINEQFQLIEQTQQQIQLETKNNQLLLKNNRFENITYFVLILLLLSIVVITLFVRRTRELKESEYLASQKLQFNPRTKLPSHQLQVQNYEYQYQGKPLFYALVYLPFLNNLNANKGLFNSETIEIALGNELREYCADDTQVIQVRDNQLLFISEQADRGEAERFALDIECFFKKFTHKYKLQSQIASGIVAFPFLNNVSRAIAPERMLNLTSLALYGACQIQEKTQQSSWLELYAIEKIQPAFFDGDLWTLGQTGIDKGIVKIKSSHPTTTINWPILKRQ